MKIILNVYLLEQIDFGYDDVAAVAVVAKDEQQARKVAHDGAGYLARSIDLFLDPAAVTCKEIDLSEPGMILYDYNDG